MGEANWRWSTKGKSQKFKLKVTLTPQLLTFQATLSGTRQTRRQRWDFEPPGGGSDYHPFGKSGGGAPLKTGSGKLQTSLKADPCIRFQNQLKKEVNDTMVGKYARLEINGMMCMIISSAAVQTRLDQ